MPNATSKTVEHNISNMDHIIDLRGVSYKNNVPGLPLPYIATDTAHNICLYANNPTTVGIVVSIDRSSYKAYIIMEYIKTTN